MKQNQVLKNIEELRNKLYEAKLKFTDNSKLVKNLELQIRKLEPVLIQFQNQALDQLIF